MLLFTVMNKNIRTAEIYKTGDDYSVKKLVTGVIQPFPGEVFNIHVLYKFLETRCFDNGRADLENILKEHGLSSNNPWEWIKINHGLSLGDNWWILFPGEKITWEELRNDG